MVHEQRDSENDLYSMFLDERFPHKEISRKVFGPTGSESSPHLLVWVYRDVYTTWTAAHGPPHGPGPWTTPNFQKEFAPVNLKI